MEDTELSVYLKNNGISSIESSAYEALEDVWKNSISQEYFSDVCQVLSSLDTITEIEVAKASKNVSQKILNEYKTQLGDAIEIYTADSDCISLDFDSRKMKFVKCPKEKTTSYDKLLLEMHQTRFQILFQRLKRHKSIVIWTKAEDVNTENKIVISTVDAVSLSSTEIQHLIGNLGRNRQGDLCIQGTQVELILEIKDCKKQKGIYCEGHIVLVSGNIKLPDRIMTVDAIMHPSFNVNDEFDYFSGDVFGGDVDSNKLKILKNFREHSLFNGEVVYWVIISNLNLDDIATFVALESLFEKLVKSANVQPIPVGFIFMGNFFSRSFSFSTKFMNEDKLVNVYEEGFGDLSFLLLKYPLLLDKCYFIFVPGPGDACVCSQLIPRMPILNHFVDIVKKNLQGEGSERKIYFTTSPAKIRHMDRKIVLFSNNVLEKLLSYSLVSSSDDNIATPDILVKILINTLVGQAHLYPVPYKNNIAPKFDYFQSLCPLPDFICLADITAPCFIDNITDKCIISNADGYFSSSKTFLVYNVLKNKVDKYSI